MKKILSTIILFLLLVSPVSASTNTHSIDLELSSSQYLSRTNANLSSGFPGSDHTSDMTFEAWVKPESLPSDGLDMTFISKWGSTNSYTINILNTSGTYYLRFIINDGTGNGVASQSLGTFSTGNWYHLAGAFDASAATIELYKNGASLGTTGSLKNSIQNGSDAFLISGLLNPSFVSPFDGLVDEVRIWNDLRTDTEISGNYQKELVGTESNLQGYWKLNDSLLDETSNSNDLTNNNSATFSTDIPFIGAVRRIFLIN